MSGPITGIGAYPQSEPPFPSIGRIACAMRGPRSRAGLIAYPVGPPSDNPIPQTKLPTRYGPSPEAGPVAETPLEKIAPTTKTSTKVAMTSLSKFVTPLRIAGAVQKHASLISVSGVSFQSGW